MVFIGNYSVFNVFFRLSTSFCMKIRPGVFSLLNSDGMVYSLYKNISLSWTMLSFYFPLSVIFGCNVF